jgi:hypothetical protein
MPFENADKTLKKKKKKICLGLNNSCIQPVMG